MILWDVGTWQPLSPVAVNGKYPRDRGRSGDALARGSEVSFEREAAEGDFALIKMRGRRREQGQRVVVDQTTITWWKDTTLQSTRRCSAVGPWNHCRRHGIGAVERAVRRAGETEGSVAGGPWLG